jgi:hypothetical protein
MFITEVSQLKNDREDFQHTEKIAKIIEKAAPI